MNLNEFELELLLLGYSKETNTMSRMWWLDEDFTPVIVISLCYVIVGTKTFDATSDMDAAYDYFLEVQDE